MMIPDEYKHLVKITKEAEKTENADLLGAFPESDTLKISLEVPRCFGLSSPMLEIYADDTKEKTLTPLVWASLSGDCEIYKTELCLGELCAPCHSGLFFWTVVSESIFGKIRFSYDEFSYFPKISAENDKHDSFVLTVYEDSFTTPDWLKGGMIYHIFVDRFCKGSRPVPCRSDAIMNENWDDYRPQYAAYPGGEVANNMFFGGTLYGVAEKLDYLESLGVTCIYLSPIFEAYSNHKYDTGDYEKIDEMFGGDEALDILIAEAKKRNISIILDGVFNHTGDDSKYFNRKSRYKNLGAYNSPDSPYFKWYSFSSYPDKYRCWWDIKVVPAVDTKNPSYDQYINGEDGIIAKYLKKGIAGWRLDVADELNEVFLENLRARARETDENALILGEVWEDASIKIAYSSRRKYFRGRELDSVMNYPLRTGIIKFVTTGNADELFSATAGLYSHYPKKVSDVLMNFLGTHDTERILSVLGSGCPDMTNEEKSHYKMPEKCREKGEKLLKLAYTLLAFLPGIPSIFYGDEAGIEGLSDPFNRATFPWGRENKSLTEFYREIGALRRGENLASLCTDGYLKVSEGLPIGIFEFERFDGKGNTFTVTVNCSENPYRHSRRSKNLIEHLFEASDKMGTLPPMSAGIWLKKTK